MKSELFSEVFPFTHHFYPLHKHTKKDGTYINNFLTNLSKSKPNETENLIYIHIPFCHNHCLFCPFHATTDRNSDIIKRYIDAVIREIQIYAEYTYIKDMKINAVYFGGGSPSAIPIKEIKKLTDAIVKHFDIASNCEWTFEGEPITLANDELMNFLKEQKFNRISFGIQTFNQSLREKLEIISTLDDIERCSEIALKYKFDDINVDMLYYLPGQTVEDLKFDIENINRHKYTSVDYYYLSYFGFPKKVFDGMLQGSFPARPTDLERYKLHEEVMNFMGASGYKQVTENLYSLNSSPSNFYRLCWGGGYGEYSAETIALGCSARGYIDGYSYANATNPHNYIKEIENGEIPLFKVSDRLNELENRGIVFFPKFLAIEKKKIQGTRYADNFARYISDGLLEESGEWYRLTPKGTYYSPSITVDLFEHDQDEISEKWRNEYETNYNNKTCR